MSGESPSQNILNQGGPQVCNTATATTTAGAAMIPNSVAGSPGVDSAIAASAQLNPNSNPIQTPSNQGQVPSNQGQMSQNIGLNNYQQGLVQGQGQAQMTAQKIQRLQQQQQLMMLSSSSAQQNMGSNAIQSPTGVMHRSASLPRMNPSQQYNSSRSPTIYGHSSLPFNHPLQHQQQQQQQQQQLGGLPRSTMMGQGQGPGHISMLSGPAGSLSTFQTQFLTQQARQKQVQIQNSQFQQLVSSGQPLQGMQTIGLMSPLGTASQNRMNGTLVYAQQRIAQGALRSPPTTQQQALSSPQKIQTQNLSRLPSGASLNSQLTGLSQGGQSAIVPSSLPHTQQWSKMQQANLSPSSSPSYQLQQHQRQQQAQLQQQAPPSPSQQQPITSHPQQLSQQQNPSQLQQHQLQQSLQMQPISRTASLTVQKPSTPTGSQPGTPASSIAIPAGSNNQGTEGSPRILGKRSIEDLVAQVDPTMKLDPDVIDMLLELADDYYQSAEINAIAYAKHRKSTTVEEKDMILHLNKNCHLSIPGYTTNEFNKNKKPSFGEAHVERLAKVQKSMAAPQMESEAVLNNGAPGPVTGNSNSGVQVAKVLQNSVPIVASSMGSPGVQKNPRF